ncbi:class I SAM-dependent methyltransferase [Agrobacterium sp. SHOUNA12C]|uniref:Methyltransferase n=1 Tax=Rhizobium rhizogenes NBRC 13257 TaxID=1220581 RepID=A0AA87Q1S4_RHIRH|nr:class I SAM-dependent methyltransferase [Rhizobium rhizogenes]MCJ9724251.1 class I SAM-dependent methyltransferase [Agrobacterium sp. BETTINA12B]MCJ9759798.1 class I SAM-dependent methyltransferase [Agrobacterium sp. SHOUNA12C]OCI92337.1 SAM-dependent methyltransferase [Agrobacterium sp. 13-626]KEA05939.1 SAM-dependent methyltransferase [Rhizobium rhizogenes]MQB32524.1 class I SAM-dependent methyltransferase [Rhizobium rhizogenes]
MTQNIYDDPAFFQGYSQLQRSIDGLAGAAEWPSMRALLPDLHGLDIVDLGCGFGWFCRWAREQGAANVLGLDVSDNMLARAESETADMAIRYGKADLEDLQLPVAAFDLVYSSLAFHYIQNVSGLLATIHQALKPGGWLIFSIEHPIYMAPRRPNWLADAEGRKTWPLDSYQMEGPRVTNWLAEGVVKQHRTMGTTLNLLIRSGFTIAHVEEWTPTDGDLAAHPDWAIERERPMFLLISTTK